MNSRNISMNEQKKEFENIKSDFIFKKIISFIKRNKSLNIMKYNKKYYHIYFDDSKEEIKRNYFKIDEKIKTVKIIIDYQVKSFKDLFYNCKCINSIRFKKFYRINITDMSYMFYGCSSLKEINLTNFNTNDVINMSHMFYGCSSLKELNLTNFDTNNVIDMKDMFSECSDELKNKINLKCQKIFKTSKLKK